MWLEDAHIGQRRYNRRVVIKSSGKHKMLYTNCVCFTTPNFLCTFVLYFPAGLLKSQLQLSTNQEVLTPQASCEGFVSPLPFSPLPPAIVTVAVNKSFARCAPTLLSASHSLHNHPRRQVLLMRMKNPRLGDGSPRDYLAEKWQSQDSNWLAPPEPELYLLGPWFSKASCGPLVSHGNRF